MLALGSLGSACSSPSSDARDTVNPHDTTGGDITGGDTTQASSCLELPCAVNARCAEVDGTAACFCKDGYEGDPIKDGCTTIDACLNSPCGASHASCTDLLPPAGGGPNGRTCTCDPGFAPAPDADTECRDVDECADRALNTCDPRAICSNTLGSYTCTCPADTFDPQGDGRTCTCDPGFAPASDADTECRDVDECADGALNTCDAAATCSNTVGSYACACPAYTFDPQGDGRTCDLITENLAARGDRTSPSPKAARSSAGAKTQAPLPTRA